MNIRKWLDNYHAEHPSFAAMWDDLSMNEIEMLEHAFISMSLDSVNETLDANLKMLKAVKDADVQMVYNALDGK